MFRKRQWLWGAAIAPLLGSVAQAQWFYCQRWNNELDSVESRVKSCDDPNTPGYVAWDDWEADQDRVITRVRWWGELSDPDFTSARYMIRIARQHVSSCAPGQVLLKRCVTPRVVSSGTDCFGHTVYTFTSRLPGGFSQKAGRKYWISIAEIEDESATTEQDPGSGGGVDFRWSGHQDPDYCHALQFHSTGYVIQPINSACNGAPMDLAFCLKETTAGGGAGTIAARRFRP